MTRPWPLLLLLPLAIVLTTGRPAVGEDAPLANPHGADDGCGACHEPAADTEGYGDGWGAPKPVVATCRGCHPTADMHPVDITPSSVVVPHAFPLEEGRVVCSTCHAETAHGGEDADLPAPWFRGGPYDRITDLCFQCHQPAEYQRVNPHLGRHGDRGSCSACHVGPPLPGSRPREARLRTEPAKTCATCHTGDVHTGVPEHLGRQVPAEIAAALPRAVPLDTDRRVACFSCHEVHDGVGGGAVQPPVTRALWDHLREREWSGVSDDARFPGEGEGHPMLSLPLEGDDLCTACHPEAP